MLTLTERCRPLRTVHVPLPQHPLAGTFRRELNVAAVAEAVGTEFLEYGWSAHELPVLAAILTVASSTSQTGRSSTSLGDSRWPECCALRRCRHLTYWRFAPQTKSAQRSRPSLQPTRWTWRSTGTSLRSSVSPTNSMRSARKLVVIIVDIDNSVSVLRSRAAIDPLGASGDYRSHLWRLGWDGDEDAKSTAARGLRRIPPEPIHEVPPST